jgi:hypothetical protein
MTPMVLEHRSATIPPELRLEFRQRLAARAVRPTRLTLATAHLPGFCLDGVHRHRDRLASRLGATPNCRQQPVSVQGLRG